MLDRMGTRALQGILNEELGRHIKDKLPAIHTKLKISLREIENELQERGFFDQKEEMIQTKSFKT